MKKFRVAAVFSDGCVLQRGKTVCIFGEGKDGALVSATLSSEKGTVLAENDSIVKDGKWRVFLPPVSACEGCTLAVSCESDDAEECGGISFSDVAVGEVWLAGGQSNMEFELRNCAEGPEELAKMNDTAQSVRVRYYYTPKNSFFSPRFYEQEDASHWTKWGDSLCSENGSCATWSAVAYFCAKRLSQALGVTVGIIGCNWGGTSASAWIPRARLQEDVHLSSYLDDYERAVSGKSLEQQCDEFESYSIQRERWLEKAKTNPPEQLEPDPWPGPMGCHNPCRPCGLYDCLVSRVMPYTMKGFLYYQGESDDHKPHTYDRLLATLISQWRSDWGNRTMPFVIVQLPEHRDANREDSHSWCVIRQAQQHVWQTVRNTVLVPALGLGAYDNIHPVHKKELGERICAALLYDVYRQKGAAFALPPVACNALRSGSKVILTVAHAGAGLTFRTDAVRLEHYRDMEALQGHAVPDDFTGMEVCASDGVYHPATAEYVQGCSDGVVLLAVTAENVTRPTGIRYGWYNYGPVTWFGVNGLPLLPFLLSC